jgi:DNA-directed RNA polymerase specialized sigma24 family protein
VSTRYEQQTRAPGGGWPGGAGRIGGADPAEEVALVAHAKRELLLRAHRHRLRREDLEDSYSQATLELVGQARGGARFASRAHIGNTLEQRFVSRIQDRRRALSGRSPMQAALETAISLGDAEEQQAAIVDVRADLETLVMLRQDLRRVEALAQELTVDQRLIIASQVAGQTTRAEFCERFDWSTEKYRKTAQRARARLARLMAEDERGVPPRARTSEGHIGTAYDYLSPHS